MMEFIAQLIREFILEFPGAYVRWLYFGKKKKFLTFLSENQSPYNYIISFVVIVAFVLLFVLVIK